MGTAMSASYYREVPKEGFQIEVDSLNKELEYFLSTYKFRDRMSLLGRANYYCIKKALLSCKPMDVGLTYSCLIDPQWYLYPTTFQLPNYPVGNLRDFNFNVKSLLDAKSKGYVRGGEELWTQCEAYPALIFRPWRLL